MNNRDEITIHGKVYVAVEGEPCSRCHLSYCCFDPAILCMTDEREDGRDVIFVEKQ